MLAAQQRLLDDALSNLEDERPGATDLYFVGFAGDAREDVFRKDVEAARKVMDERWGTNGRSIALINNPRTLLEAPLATVTNLRETLNEIGATIDVEQDVVMVYLASHGSRDHVLTVTMPPLEVAPLTAPALRGLLDASGIKWRIVVVSACYSGGFIDALKDDYTLVLTAAADQPHVVRLRATRAIRRISAKRCSSTGSRRPTRCWARSKRRRRASPSARPR